MCKNIPGCNGLLKSQKLSRSSYLYKHCLSWRFQFRTKKGVVYEGIGASYNIIFISSCEFVGFNRLREYISSKYERKIGSCFQQLRIVVVGTAREPLRQEKQLSFQRSVILWSDRQALARGSMDKTQKCSRREILFENFHAFLKKCK